MDAEADEDYEDEEDEDDDGDELSCVSVICCCCKLAAAALAAQAFLLARSVVRLSVSRYDFGWYRCRCGFGCRCESG